MTRKPGLVLGLAGAALLLTAACSVGQAAVTGGGAEPAGSAALASNRAKVLFLGDCIAVAESQALAAAAGAGDFAFESIAAEGGGNVVGPFADEQWQELPGKIASAKPSVVVYQISTFDWGTEQEQEAAYHRLVNTVADAGAKLVFVTMPPIEPDDFYQPHMADMDRTTSVARRVADASAGKATLLDASAVWGNAYQQFRDGKPDRSSDGIHICPQSAARFTAWLLAALTGLVPGLTSAPAESWANTGWSADRHFQGC
ncbi:SGNH/GDSL hydrolase family protein [Amycolatopsis pigmentata]|uniref:SGNH/GDSL hydrolase family protein n=1 Tax=Amycolatopsis pigmentata TaxID=450801 RepID=A0ABW5GCU0_9PSEU